MTAARKAPAAPDEGVGPGPFAFQGSARCRPVYAFARTLPSASLSASPTEVAFRTYVARPCGSTKTTWNRS